METFIYHVTTDLSLTKTTLGSLGSRMATSHPKVKGLGFTSYLLVLFFNSYTFYFLAFNTVRFLLHYCNANFPNK